MSCPKIQKKRGITPLSEEITKELVISNKKDAIKQVNNLLEKYINDPSGNHLKKAHLISYWLKEYVQMIDFEETFDPKRNISYKRGNIVKLNFGFNVGSEYGGLHYGIVLDNHNAHNSPVVTIVPLTSLKDKKKIHENSVDLGNEIYRCLKLKYDTISKSLKEESKELIKQEITFSSLMSMANDLIDDEMDDDEFEDKYGFTHQTLEHVRQIKEDLDKKIAHNESQQEYLNKIGDEISKMKQGSIALINQVTTVSKIRIYDPRNIKGVLSGISLSAESIDKINEKMKELYIY